MHLGLFGRFRRVPRRRSAATTSRPCGCGWWCRRRRSISSVRPTARSAPSTTAIDSCARLGPDPLRADADPDKAYAAIVRRVAPIGQLLLDQKVISGLGNVYRAEALFLNRINPESTGHGDHARRCSTACGRRSCEMLRATASASNRIVTLDRDQFDVPDGVARRGETTYVYHRDLCLRCGSPIHDGRARWAALLLLPGRSARLITAHATAARRHRRASSATAASASVAADGSARPARTRISVAATRRSSAIASANGSPRERLVRNPRANAFVDAGFTTPPLCPCHQRRVIP